jgi:hypothetical protein
MHAMDTSQLVAMSQTLVGLGGNCPGPWGTPAETIARALRELGMAVGQADHQAASDTHTAGTNGSGRTTEGEEIVEGEFEAV